MKQMKHYRKDIPRLSAFYLIFSLMFSALALGLGWRQVVQHKLFVRQEKQQSLRRILHPGTRGDIIDRNGVLLVGNRPVFSAVIYLSELRPAFKEEYKRQIRVAKKKGETLDRGSIRQKSRERVVDGYIQRLNFLLGRELSINAKDLERHFSQQLLLPFPLVKDLTLEEYAILTERLPVTSPIQIYTDSTRYYPYGALACHVLGYVGSSLEATQGLGSLDNLKTFRLKGKVGRNGLEKKFDDRLQGKSGAEIWLVDPAGFQCERLEKIAPTQGPTLCTSLDLETQLAAERALGNMTGAVVALEVKTGEVLAMTSHPNYDLNALVPNISNTVYEEIDTQGAWLNRATQGLYPPGSPFKIITALAALRAGCLPMNRQIDCHGGMMVGTRRFPCMKRSGHGLIDLKEAIAYSCNPFFYQLALEIGAEALGEEARRFGLDKPTGIDLPYEAQHSFIPTPAWKKERQGIKWLGGDTANMSIGQGFLLVTPLQMACFTASFARGQTLTQPTLLHSQQPLIQHTAPIAISREEYLNLIQGMEMTTQSGTGRRMQIPGIRIAAKTGTAQVTVKGEPMDLAWCIAFAPIEDPKIAVSILVEEVDKADRYQGGLTASPIAKAVLEAYLK